VKSLGVFHRYGRCNRASVLTIATNLLPIFLLALSVTAPQAAQRAEPEGPRTRHADYQVPAGTYLQIELRTNLSSNSSAAGDPVDGRLRLPLTSEGVEVVPAGAKLLGTVREVESAGKKLRGRLVFAFHLVEHPETGSLATIKSSDLTFASPTPKKGNVYPELKLEKGHEVSVSLLAPLTVRIPRAK
jgi:hypothetical protein